MPYLQALYVKLKAKKFEILAVAMDREGKRVVEPFIKKGKYTFKVLLDPKGVVSSPYAIVGIPTTFILDRNGRIVDKIVGSRNWTEAKTFKQISRLVETNKLVKE